MNDEKVLKYLNDKYAIDFVIQSTEYIANIDQYQIKAHPEYNSIVKFVVEYNPAKGVMNDNYIESHFQNEANDFMTSILASLDIPHVFSVNHAYYGLVSDPKNLPEWKSLYNQEASQMNLILKVNVFSNPSIDILNQFVVVDELLREKQFKKAGFSISFFESSAIVDEEIETIEFSYSTDRKYFEYQHKNQFISKILYYIDKKNPSIEASQLKNILNDKFFHITYELL